MKEDTARYDCMHCACIMYDGDMKNVQVRNVPERVHKVLRRRAAQAGQSMQEYLLQLLEEEAVRPSVAEVLEEAAREATGRIGFKEAVEDIHQAREERGRGWS
jgi:antitoxin FitA